MGLAGRVTFSVADAVAYPGAEYGLVCFFDALHDMGDPVAAARHTARVLAPDGAVTLIEPFANNRVEGKVSWIASGEQAGTTIAVHTFLPETGVV